MLLLIRPRPALSPQTRSISLTFPRKITHS